MTKRDYERIARALSHAEKEMVALEFISARDLLDKIIGYISYELKADNPRFDPVKFKEAIY